MKFIPRKPAQLRKAITLYTKSIKAYKKQKNPPSHIINYLLHKVDVYKACLAATKSQYTKNSDIIF